jgi:amidophosphoribosyltransferase
MCGIIGVSGIPDAARLTYLGLYALQHRGQESAGIVAIDRDGFARSHRGMGLVSENFDDTLLGGLPGDIAVGHTRYSTTGSTVLANAQPCNVNTRCGPLAIAHNGNLVNADAIKRELVERGAIFTSSSDTEVLVHLIARSEADTADDQIRDALEQVDGAYSLVITVGRTMYAVVDSRGFRPLVIGRLGNGIVIASETCALDLI